MEWLMQAIVLILLVAILIYARAIYNELTRTRGLGSSELHNAKASKPKIYGVG